MGVLENKFQDNVIVASMDKLLGWAQPSSLSIEATITLS